jgi:CRP-like cAMP-binding protein/Zn-dependent protease
VTRTSVYEAIGGRAPGRDEGAGELGGVWEELAGRVDPSRFRPKLAPDVELKEFRPRLGNPYAMIGNPRDLVHFRLEADEIELVRQMDGTRTVKELVVERFQGSGDLELDPVVELVRELQEGRFLDPPPVDVRAALDRARNPSRVRTKLREFLKTLSIEWAGAERLVVFLYRYGVRWFFTAPAIVLGGILSALGLWAFISLVQGGRFSLTGQSLAGEFLILIALNYSLTFLHELGHAVVLVHYGRRVKSAGFMIYFGSPAFFIESSEVLMLEPRKRIVQAAAGPFAELMLAGAASITALAFPEAPISGVLYKFAVLNYFVLTMNLIPLIELDGYFILADLIQVPNLRPRAVTFVRYDLLRKIRDREPWRRVEVGLVLYGVLGIAFGLFSLYSGIFFWREIFGSLIADLWSGGPLTQVMLVALGLLVAGPIVRGALSLLRALGRRARGLWRSIRFRLEQPWRIEAAELIDRLPLFDEVPVDVLNDLAGRVRLRSIAPGQPVVRQGDRPDAFYVVRRGILEVVEEDPETGARRLLRTLERGESFGELGLLEQAPRAATVRATTEAELFQVDKGTFDQLLAEMAQVPDFGPTLQAAAELRSLPPFSHLDQVGITELLGNGTWVVVAPGERIVQEGEIGDAFYAIASGQVEVTKDGVAIRTLGPGSFFGEVALLLDVPRTATVRAITAVRAFRLGREGFERLVGDAFRRGTLNPHIMASREQRH